LPSSFNIDRLVQSLVLIIMLEKYKSLNNSPVVKSESVYKFW